MVVAHTNFTEVTGMVLIEVGAVVVLTTSETATSRMFTVLSNATVTGRDVATVLASLREVGRHFLEARVLMSVTLPLSFSMQNWRQL